MAVVNHMYSERELTTKIEWNVTDIIHQSGHDWCSVADWNNTLFPGDFWDGELYAIARNSKLDVDAFVFLTGSTGRENNTLMGMAYKEVTCDPDKGKRISLSMYCQRGFKTRDAYSAEVRLEHDPRFGCYLNIMVFLIHR